MLLLRTTCIINTKQSDGEGSIPDVVCGEDRFDEEDKMTFSPLEAVAAILVQHGEVIATTYNSEGAVVVTDSDTVNSNSVTKSDVPDSVVPVNKVNCPAPKIYSPDFVATTNSTKAEESQVDAGRNPHNLRVTSGMEHWHDYKTGFQWAYALYSPVLLVNHAATVCAYLEEYRCEPDSEKRMAYSNRFSTHLLSLCWPKMHSRVMSRPFIGLIHNIRHMDHEVLAIEANKLDWPNYKPGPGDRSLAAFLAPSNIDRLVLMVEEAAGGSVQWLMQALRTVAEDQESSEEPSRGFTVRFYTKETFTEFHRLLPGCLILYAKALHALRITFARGMRGGMTTDLKETLTADPKKGLIL